MCLDCLKVETTGNAFVALREQTDVQLSQLVGLK